MFNIISGNCLVLKIKLKIVSKIEIRIQDEIFAAKIQNQNKIKIFKNFQYQCNIFIILSCFGSVQP